MNLFKIMPIFIISLWLLSQQTAYGEELMDDWLLSSRFELIQYSNFDGAIREVKPEANRLYFSNVYLNLEGALSDQADFIFEMQAKTSDLYLLGGFVTIADSLEGIGSDEDETLNDRQEQISQLARDHLTNITRSEDEIKFERANVDYQFNDGFGVKLGSVRIPFGFWDDYSLLRNLSAGKTDPVTMGVQLRRSDMGAVMYTDFGGSAYKYEMALVYGEEVFELSDGDGSRDMVLKLGGRFNTLDFGVNSYLRDMDNLGDIYALGVYYRYRRNARLTILGESVYMRNEVEQLHTRFSYIQGNYDLGDSFAGLRWNFFLESYNSDLLKADLEEDLSYEFAGTHIQLSTGILYAYTRNIDMGMQFISGVDEEGDLISRFTAKLDVRF
jgi:hypothetical protein